jgi:hypothetical protein
VCQTSIISQNTDKLLDIIGNKAQMSWWKKSIAREMVAPEFLVSSNSGIWCPLDWTFQSYPWCLSVPSILESQGFLKTARKRQSGFQNAIIGYNNRNLEEQEWLEEYIHVAEGWVGNPANQECYISFRRKSKTFLVQIRLWEFITIRHVLKEILQWVLQLEAK